MQNNNYCKNTKVSKLIYQKELKILSHQEKFIEIIKVILESGRCN